MTSLESGLRELIAELVRDEVRRALGDAPKHDEFLSTPAAAQVADVAQGTIRRWVREGRLEAHRAGRVVRVRRADLERVLRDGGKPTSDASPASADAWVRKHFG